MNRRFSLLDGIALVAATAMGLALPRPASGLFDQPWPYDKVSRIQVRFLLQLILTASTPILFSWSVATLALDSRQPRPPLRRQVRRPGFVLNLAGVMGVLIVLAFYMAQMALMPNIAYDIYMHVLTGGLSDVVGYFVAGSLIPLALRGHWRSRPVWTDRLGWAMGVAWLVMVVLNWLVGYLNQ